MHYETTYSPYRLGQLDNRRGEPNQHDLEERFSQLMRQRKESEKRSDYSSSSHYLENESGNTVAQTDKAIPLLRTLEAIDFHVKALATENERLRLLRDQYKFYLIHKGIEGPSLYKSHSAGDTSISQSSNCASPISSERRYTPTDWNFNFNNTTDNYQSSIATPDEHLYADGFYAPDLGGSQHDLVNNVLHPRFLQADEIEKQIQQRHPTNETFTRHKSTSRDLNSTGRSAYGQLATRFTIATTSPPNTSAYKSRFRDLKSATIGPHEISSFNDKYTANGRARKTVNTAGWSFSSPTLKRNDDVLYGKRRTTTANRNREFPAKTHRSTTTAYAPSDFPSRSKCFENFDDSESEYFPISRSMFEYLVNRHKYQYPYSHLKTDDGEIRPKKNVSFSHPVENEMNRFVTSTRGDNGLQPHKEYTGRYDYANKFEPNRFTPSLNHTPNEFPSNKLSPSIFDNSKQHAVDYAFANSPTTKCRGSIEKLDDTYYGEKISPVDLRNEQSFNYPRDTNDEAKVKSFDKGNRFEGVYGGTKMLTETVESGTEGLYGDNGGRMVPSKNDNQTLTTESSNGIDNNYSSAYDAKQKFSKSSAANACDDESKYIIDNNIIKSLGKISEKSDDNVIDSENVMSIGRAMSNLNIQSDSSLITDHRHPTPPPPPPPPLGVIDSNEEYKVEELSFSGDGGGSSVPLANDDDKIDVGKNQYDKIGPATTGDNGMIIDNTVDSRMGEQIRYNNVNSLVSPVALTDLHDEVNSDANYMNVSQPISYEQQTADNNAAEAKTEFDYTNYGPTEETNIINAQSDNTPAEFNADTSYANNGRTQEVNKTLEYENDTDYNNYPSAQDYKSVENVNEKIQPSPIYDQLQGYSTDETAAFNENEQNYGNPNQNLVGTDEYANYNYTNEDRMGYEQQTGDEYQSHQTDTVTPADVGYNVGDQYSTEPYYGDGQETGYYAEQQDDVNQVAAEQSYNPGQDGGGFYQDQSQIDGANENWTAPDAVQYENVEQYEGVEQTNVTADGAHQSSGTLESN